jgi:ribonuclease Z
MKPTFHANPVNGPFEDPCVYVRLLRERRSLLFDLGYIGRLDAGNIAKITDVFVTHTHMDHFMGFDTLLRSLLKRDTPLRVFGPENIIECIEGKLKGYTWNLIEDYPLKIEAFGIGDNFLSHACFYAGNSFRRKDMTSSPFIGPFNGVIVKDPLFVVKGLVLSHQIPVIAYSMEEDFHININKAILADMGLPIGPWLSDFKRTIREQQSSRAAEQKPEKKIFEVNNMIFTLQELMRIATITRGQKIAYVMDVAPTDRNIEKLIQFVKGSDTLFCEAYFLESDRNRAEERHHLTAALAGRIAREAGVGNLVIMHFSPKYRHCAEEIYQEAMKEFRGHCIGRPSII